VATPRPVGCYFEGSQGARPLNLSAILVVVPAPDLDAAIGRLEALPGVEVRHTDPATGRILALQEADDVAAEVAGLGRIQALPGIVLAEMVYHYFGDDPEIAALSGDGPPAPVPAFLDD